MTTGFRDKHGAVISQRQWLILINTPEYRTIDSTDLDRFRIHTVWVGAGPEPFRTVVYIPDPMQHLGARSYLSLAQAVAGHAEAVEAIARTVDRHFARLN